MFTLKVKYLNKMIILNNVFSDLSKDFLLFYFTANIINALLKINCHSQYSLNSHIFVTGVSIFVVV